MTKKTQKTQLNKAIEDVKALNSHGILCVRIPYKSTQEDATRIREELKVAAPGVLFLIVKELEVTNLEDITPDLKDQIADVLLADEEFIEKLRMILSSECQYRVTTTPTTKG